MALFRALGDAAIGDFGLFYALWVQSTNPRIILEAPSNTPNPPSGSVSLYPLDVFDL